MRVTAKLFSRADSHGFCSWGLLVPRLCLGTQGSGGSASARSAARQAEPARQGVPGQSPGTRVTAQLVVRICARKRQAQPALLRVGETAV
jgi:hypothetical protein